MHDTVQLHWTTQLHTGVLWTTESSCTHRMCLRSARRKREPRRERRSRGTTAAYRLSLAAYTMISRDLEVILASSPFGSMHVLKIIEVTTYGSQLDAGRRSSK